MESLAQPGDIVHLDALGGVAGDMFIASALDCFPELEKRVEAAVNSVLPESIGTIKAWRAVSKGISGLRIDLDFNEGNVNGKRLEKTTYTVIKEIFLSSDLDASSKHISLELLGLLAKAEARVHAQDLDRVHFHELADWDSVMDIVAAATILDSLSPAMWSLSKLPIGQGLVSTEHGRLPVPAPATLELLKGFEFFDDGIVGERITPTGAAILKYLKEKGLLTQVGTSNSGRGILNRIGYGLGSKEFDGIPNILRMSSFRASEKVLSSSEIVGVIEFSIDDMTGEEISLAIETLRKEEAVIDLFSVAARGKKGRALEHLVLLVDPASISNVIEACFRQTSTIGLRWRHEFRSCLERVGGMRSGFRTKTVVRPGGEETTKVEADDLVDGPTLDQRRKIKAGIEYGEK